MSIRHYHHGSSETAFAQGSQWLRTGIVVVCLFVVHSLAVASGVVVLETEQAVTEIGQVVTFNFSQQLIFVRQYPSTLCKQCVFYLKPTTFNPTELADLAHDEAISVRSMPGAWLLNARYQGDPQGNITVTVDFSQTVSIAVTQDANKRTLQLDISNSATPDQPNIAAVPAVTKPAAAKPVSATATEKSAAPTPIVKKPAEPTLFDIMHPVGGAPAVVYVINLESSTNTIDLAKLKEIPELSSYDSYVTKTEIRKQVWQRGRLGYFNSMQEALKVLPTVTTQFTQAWVDKATEEEHKRSEKWYIQHAKEQAKVLAVMTAENAPVEQIAATVPPVVTAAVSSATENTATTKSTDLPATPGNVSDAKMRELFEHARQAMIDTNYDVAIRDYSKILATGKGQELKDAKEFLGLARERNGQLAHAKAEYQEYLKLYPTGADAERVKQRLIGLATARSKPKVELANPEPKKAQDAHWEFNNSVSQYYRFQSLTVDTAGKSTTDNSISSDFSSGGRYRGEKYDIRTQVNFSHRYTLLDTATDSSDTNISTAYFDVNNKDLGLSVRAGRLSSGSDGVLGRFDGALASYRLNPQWKLNAVLGQYVTPPSSAARDEKSFFGMSADIGTLAKHWDLKFYAINQTVDGIEDRSAIGTEVKYIDDSFSVFSLLDYDVGYSSLNTIFFVGNWRFKDNSSFNINMDMRNTPTLTTSNALQGQTTATTISQLMQTFTEAEVRQLAVDRTASSKSASASYSFPLSEKYQMSADMTVSNVGGTPASGGVAENPSLGSDYYFSTQLIGTNIFTANDITIYGLRYSTGATSDIISGSMSTRFALMSNNKWRFNPKFRIDKQDQNTGGSRMNYLPAMRVDYIAKNNLRFDAELGYQYSSISNSTGGSTETSYYIFMGYIYDF